MTSGASHDDWEPRIGRPDAQAVLLLWLTATGHRIRLELALPSLDLATVVGEFRVALDERLRCPDRDVRPNAPARDSVLLVARQREGEHSFGHGPLDAPAGIPRMNLRGLIEFARSRLG